MTYVLLLLIFFLLLLSAFFSGAETGSYCVNPVRLRLRSDEGNSAARRLRRLLDDRQAILSVTLIGTNVANYLMTVCVAICLGRVWETFTDRELEVYTTLILTPVIFVFGEMVPKNWFRQDADRLMERCSSPLAAFAKILRGLGAVAFLKWLSGHLLRWWHGGTQWEQAIHPRRKIVSLLKEGVAEGVLSEEQSKLVDGVLSLSNQSVGSVMIAISDVVKLGHDAQREDVLETIRNHRYSRYPVLGQDRRSIVGVINVYEFLADPVAQSLDSFISKPLALEPQSTVSAALYAMRESRQTFGTVLDQWGNCVGVVTAKDLVEEIVGDLAAW